MAWMECTQTVGHMYKSCTNTPIPSPTNPPHPPPQAPFPFVVGIQYKTADIRNRCANIARVNVYKNRVKLSGSTPQLPGHSTLVTKLVKSYAMLAAAGKAEEVPHQPVYRCRWVGVMVVRHDVGGWW